VAPVGLDASKPKVEKAERAEWGAKDPLSVEAAALEVRVAAVNSVRAATVAMAEGRDTSPP